MLKRRLFENPKGYLALLVVYLIWGTTFGFIHIGAQTFPPPVLVCLRFSVAGLLLIAFCLARKEPWPSWPDFKRDCLVGLLLLFGGNAIVAWASRYVPTGIGGILVATNPFWMLGLSAFLPPREKVNPLALVGLLVGFVGIFILLSDKMFGPHKMSSLFWLNVAGLLVMVFFWALGSMVVRKTRVKTSLLLSVGIQNLFAGLLLLPICLVTPETYHFVPSSTGILALAYLILFGTILATPCYLYVLHTLPVSIASTFAYVTPLITLLFGILFLKEGFSAMTILGAAVILLGVILVQWVEQRAVVKPTQEPEKRISPLLVQSDTEKVLSRSAPS